MWRRDNQKKIGHAFQKAFCIPYQSTTRRKSKKHLGDWETVKKSSEQVTKDRQNSRSMRQETQAGKKREVLWAKQGTRREATRLRQQDVLWVGEHKLSETILTETWYFSSVEATCGLKEYLFLNWNWEIFGSCNVSCSFSFAFCKVPSGHFFPSAPG